MARTKDSEMRAEYDFTGGVRGKHSRTLQTGHTITVHNADGTTVVTDVTPREDPIVVEPDVREYFPDSESVNRTLRCLIPLLAPKRKAGTHKA